MAIRRITSEQIAATGVNFSSASAGTDKWRQFAQVAVQIANDRGFQEFEARFINTPPTDFVAIAQVLLEKQAYVQERFGTVPFFDSGVEQAANFAVAAEVRKNARN